MQKIFDVWSLNFFTNLRGLIVPYGKNLLQLITVVLYLLVVCGYSGYEGVLNACTSQSLVTTESCGKEPMNRLSAGG